MINQQTVLAVIPARGGSKTIPRKNIRMLAGKPLIAWTIEEARKSSYIDRVIVSSEDAEIIKIAQEWGAEVPFVRPARLADDESGGIEPVLHALRTIPEYYDYVVLLQPTSPLRSADDIDGCIAYCLRCGAPACVSVSAAAKNPYWMYRLDGSGKMIPVMATEKPIERRQELPAFYCLNGSLYAAKTDYLLLGKNFITDETVAYVMPEERSLDIDGEFEFLCCALLKQQGAR